MSKPTIDRIREFNRFYTSFLGLVDRYILDSKYTLPEARILFEINRAKLISATEIMEITQMDKGYLSRLLTKFEKKGLIGRRPSDTDKRVYYNGLTDKGQKEFNILDQASFAQVKSVTDELSAADKLALREAMSKIMQILSKV